MAEPGDVDATRYGTARFAFRGQALGVFDAADLAYLHGRLAARGMALGLFDATAGGLYGHMRFGVRGVASVVSTAPLYFYARLANRGAANVLAGNAQIPEATPPPDRIYRVEGQVAIGGAEECEIALGGAQAAQVVIGGRDA
jgi:hypothetical protein